MKNSKLDIELKPSKHPSLVDVISPDLYWINESISDEELERRMEKDHLSIQTFVEENGKAVQKFYEFPIPKDLLRQDQIYLSIHPTISKFQAERVLGQARKRAEGAEHYAEEAKKRRLKFHIYPILIAIFFCYFDATSNYTEHGLKDYLITIAFCFVVGAGISGWIDRWEKECLEDLKY